MFEIRLLSNCPVRPPLHRDLRRVPADHWVLLVVHDGAAHAWREVGEAFQFSSNLKLIW